MDLQAQLYQVRQEGRQAFYDGHQVKFNPYDPKSRKRDARTQILRYKRDHWHGGWTEAQRLSQTKEPDDAQI